MFHPTTPCSKSRVAGAIFGALVVAGFVVANLPYRYVQGNGIWIGPQARDEGRSQFRPVGTPVMAGWPFRYHVAYELPDRVEQRQWSPAWAAANALVALVVATAVYAGTQYRRRKIEAAADPKQLQMRFDTAITVAAMLVPASLWGMALSTTWHHLRVARQVSSTGCCFLSSQLPEPLAHRMPAGFERSLRRIRRVQLNNPSAPLVRETAQLPTLVEYCLHRGDYRAASLRPLRLAPHLAALTITSRELDEPMVRTIAALPWLAQLTLAGTDLDAQRLRYLAQLDSLRFVDLTGTPLKLSELGKPPWSRTVRVLRLSRPPSGQSDCLTLDRWPALRELALMRRSLTCNAQTLELRLSRLPQLRRLALDRTQKHALFAQRLPRLTSINENFDVVSRDPSLSAVPAATWYSRLELRQVPSLRQISCFGPDLQSLKIIQCPQLHRLAITPFCIRPGGRPMLRRIEPAQCQRWIDALGRADGPSLIHFQAMPLGSVDLAPLANNQGIRQLKLAHSGLRFDQVRTLAPMRQLQQLEISDCRLTADQLGWLLEQFPQLERLRADFRDLRRLEIAGNEQLKELGSNQVEQLRHLRIVDAPHLRCGIHMVAAPQHLEIRNAPMLSGLAVEGPWPEGATIRGVRKLQWFAAGGPEVDDSLVEALLDCDQLDQLTLAYASLSRDALIQLKNFPGLTHLALPGARVDDSVTAHWRSMEQLRAVNLDDTAISAGTLEWLSRFESLRRLSIRRVELDQTACAALGRLTQLAQLDLGGSPVPPSAFAPILAEDLLEQLDLSGHRCSAELIELLAGCRSLRTLVWHHSEIDPARLRRLLSANPDLAIDLEPRPAELEPSLIAELDMRQRRRRNPFDSPVAWVSGFDFAFALPVNELPSAERDRPVAGAGASASTPSVSQSAARFYYRHRSVVGSIDVHRFRP